MEYNLGSIFKSLDMNYSNGLTDENDSGQTVFQKYFFAQAKEKLNIDAIYFGSVKDFSQNGLQTLM